MTIQEQLEAAAELIGGKAWGIDKGKPRIYMPSRRDCKVYFDFPDAAYSSPADQVSATVVLSGAQLKIYIEDCGQHPNWYASQKARIRARQGANGLALMAFIAGDEQLARDLLDGLADGVDGDAFAAHVVNGRMDEARALVTGAGDSTGHLACPGSAGRAR